MKIIVGDRCDVFLSGVAKTGCQRKMGNTSQYSAQSRREPRPPAISAVLIGVYADRLLSQALEEPRSRQAARFVPSAWGFLWSDSEVTTVPNADVNDEVQPWCNGPLS